MAIWQAVNVLSGTVENPKYSQIGIVSEIWRYTGLPTTLANGDTIIGPTLPAAAYLQNVRVDVSDLDTGGGITFSAGYAGALAAFIVGSTVAQTGGIQGANVSGTLGYTNPNSNVPILVTITHAAAIPVAGNMTIEISYTSNP